MARMLFSLLLFILAAHPAALRAQDTYTVQNVRGTVTLQQRPVAAGQVLASTAPLVFGAGAKLLVSSARHGRLVIQPGPQVGATETGISIQQYLASTTALGARGGAVFDNLRFANAFTVIGDAMTVEVPAAQYPLSETRYLFLSYQLTGDTEPVNKRLPHTGQEVLFDKTLIFTVDGEVMADPPLRGKLTLYYMKAADRKNYERIQSFDLLFADDKRLREELPQLLELLDYTAQPTKDNYAALLQALHDQVPWQVSHSNLEDWLEKGFGIAPVGE